MWGRAGAKTTWASVAAPRQRVGVLVGAGHTMRGVGREEGQRSPRCKWDRFASFSPCASFRAAEGEEGFAAADGDEEGGEGGWEMEVRREALAHRHTDPHPTLRIACCFLLRCRKGRDAWNRFSSALPSSHLLIIPESRIWRSRLMWQPRPRHLQRQARQPPLWPPPPASPQPTAGRPSAAWQRSRQQRARLTPPCACSHGGCMAGGAAGREQPTPRECWALLCVLAPRLACLGGCVTTGAAAVCAGKLAL